MAWDNSKRLDLDPLFYNLEIERAQESGNFHEVGRLLRTYKSHILSPKNTEEFSPLEKAAKRNLTRRSSNRKSRSDR